MSASLPLDGLRVVEIAGVGPAPFCGMMLADNGAEVIRIDRAGGLGAGVLVDGEKDVLLRSRRSISLDLKTAGGQEVVRRLAASADGLIEGFRPGVMERLGLGPEDLRPLNARLVYGRMTGWGQDGPLADLPGHDINYIAVNGVLDSIGEAGRAPNPPINLVGDFAGGGLLLAFAMTAAILSARTSGEGRVIDCAMIEGASALMAATWSLKHNRLWEGGRGENFLDGGAPFYTVYPTADGKFAAVGAVEERFFSRLCALLGLGSDPDFNSPYDRSTWPAMRAKLSRAFASRPLSHFVGLFDGEDVCFAPVISLDDAPNHPHNVARRSFVEVDGLIQPAPVPRYEDCQAPLPSMWSENSDRDSLLDELGFATAEVAEMSRDGVFGPLNRPASGNRRRAHG